MTKKKHNTSDDMIRYKIFIFGTEIPFKCNSI